jgi:hypothetical protein
MVGLGPCHEPMSVWLRQGMLNIIGMTNKTLWKVPLVVTTPVQVSPPQVSLCRCSAGVSQ